MSFRPEWASTRAVEKSRRSYQPVTEADNPISPRDPAGRLEMTALLPCLDVICTRTHVDNTATNVDKCGYVWTSRWIQRDISGKRVCKKRTGCGREVDCHRWFSAVHTEGGELWMGCPPLVRVQLGLPSGRIRSCPHYPQPLLRLLFFSIYSKEIRGTGHTSQEHETALSTVRARTDALACQRRFTILGGTSRRACHLDQRHHGLCGDIVKWSATTRFLHFVRTSALRSK